MRDARRRWISVLLAAALFAPLVLPTPATAQAEGTVGAFVDGAEQWTESDCTGETPIVVGSDAAAQSDIYSAITLAGAVGTDCVIFAGPRDGDMPADQQARLNSAEAGGYIVGGTAAVPAAKTAGRDMTRLSGDNRWATAQIVGSEAQSIAGGTAPEMPSLDTSLTAPDDVAQPGVHLRGAAPWIASDCDGDLPIVVGSDANAQSDIYSAVTLAGVVGTDCVILAGPRDGNMPVSQRARLDAAVAGGYVLGGVAAVPTAKIAGRDMTRLGGTTRWATAQLVGRRASGDTAIGTSTSDEPTVATEAGTDGYEALTSVSAGPAFSCGIRADQTIACRGSTGFDPGNAPTGMFETVKVGGELLACGVRTDGTVTCWGNNDYGQADAPAGTFVAVSPGNELACGVRTDGTVTCWGNNDYGQANAPSGTFGTVEASSEHACGIRTDSTLACWGRNDSGQANAPNGTFTAVSPGGHDSCGVRTDGTIDCWGLGYEGDLPRYTPSGTFTSIDGRCAVRTNGELTCWTAKGPLNGPSLSGTFVEIAATPGQGALCGLRTDRTLTCVAAYPGHTADVPVSPSGAFMDVAFGWGHSCGVRTNGTVSCWGRNRYGQSDAPSGTYVSVAVGYEYSCGIRPDSTISCWGTNVYEQPDFLGNKFVALAVVDIEVGSSVMG